MKAISRASSLHGNLQVPGSKSHTIRAVLLSSVAEGTSIIHNPLASGDGLSALKAARGFGIRIEEKNSSWVVQGKNGMLPPAQNVIDTGNSGTTTCFVTSMATLSAGYTVLTGDEQIRRRPIKTLVEALNALGANVFLTRSESSAPPVVIHGPMLGGAVTLNGFNSQFVSSLLLFSPFSKQDTQVTVKDPLEKPYLQMTIDWMKRFGVECNHSKDFTSFSIKSGQHYKGGEFTIPADWSAVAFPLVGSCITESELTLTGLDFNDSQGDKRVVDILLGMGADITKDERNGTLFIRGGKSLKGDLVIDLGDIPDALPALCVAASQAEGTTTFTNLAHVRVKESDRVAVMAQELGRLGCQMEIGDDYLKVFGKAELHGSTVDSHDDHRVAMALIVAGLVSKEPVIVLDSDCASVSFPDFLNRLSESGAKVEEVP